MTDTGGRPARAAKGQRILESDSLDDVESALPGSGGLPPWSVLPVARRRGITLKKVTEALSLPTSKEPGDLPGILASAYGPSPTCDIDRSAMWAAVLVPLFEEDGEARAVLTRRSEKMRTHTGQVAFPGGRIEPGEQAEQAALREATEEVGLDARIVKVVGELQPLSTLSGTGAIRPFVGALSSRPELVPNPDEVARIFDVALAELLSDGVWHEERWDIPGRPNSPVWFFELAGETIWGATARILVDLLSRVIGLVSNAA